MRGKQFPYDSGLLVPFIIKWAKRFPAPKGYRARSIDRRLVASIDIAPTMIDIAGGTKPPKMEGQILFGANAAPRRTYVFGARDRCDETVFRFRTVRDERYRFIRNFTPERPLLQPNEYKQQTYPVWNLLKELGAQGKLTLAQAVLTAPSMPAEELYDTKADPHEIANLVASKAPRHKAALERLRAVLGKWIDETDMGKELEPAEIAAAKGATKKGNGPKGVPLRPAAGAPIR